MIEGFLDILLPVEETAKSNHMEPKSNTTSPSVESEPWRTQAPKTKTQQKALFTVKPGGIAGYLGEFS